MKIFISHDTDEVVGARAVKASLRELGFDAFVAQDDIRATRWEDRIDDALRDSDAYIVLCSERSKRSDWVWMEFGAARLLCPRVIPVAVPGFGLAEVPEPFRGYQVVTLDGPEGCVDLLRQLGEVELDGVELGDVELDDGGTAMYDRIVAAFDWRHVRPGRALPSPGPQGGYLIDVSHGQVHWRRRSDGCSVFDGFGAAAEPVKVGAVPARLTERAVTVANPAQLARGHLSDFPGLVMTSPWRGHLSPETIDEIDAWVQHGGRLLLQGYEYGDRHHGANLNALAARFGLHFRTDIVAPADIAVADDGRMRKPYGEPVEFPVADGASHPVLRDVSALCALNTQSIEVEPAGRALVSTGDCVIGEPVSQSGADVDYVDGYFVGVGTDSRSRGPHPWLAVLAQAPPALCGDGEVLALGTWLLASADRHPATARFVENLERWLTGA